jgi:dTMP kinase
VVADRVQAELEVSELESLAAFATGRLRPDVSVLLDRGPADEPDADPTEVGRPPSPLPGEEHVRVRRLLTRMAAAEPHRYVVVDADGTPDDVARRVVAALTPVLPAPPTAPDAPPVTEPLGLPQVDPPAGGTATAVADPERRIVR